MAESDPTEIAVICQDTVVAPLADRLLPLIAGVLTVKCPLCELRLAETLDKTLLEALLTEFVTAAVTVAVCPTFKVEGTWLAVMLSV